MGQWAVHRDEGIVVPSTGVEAAQQQTAGQIVRRKDDRAWRQPQLDVILPADCLGAVVLVGVVHSRRSVGIPVEAYLDLCVHGVGCEHGQEREYGCEHGFQMGTDRPFVDAVDRQPWQRGCVRPADDRRPLGAL